MVFAIDDINREQTILPNISLGFLIYDTCLWTRKAIESSMRMLTGEQRPILNYQCRSQSPLTAVIGEESSTVSMAVARLLGIYRYPQVSYYSTSPLLNNKHEFPSFFRTIPSDDSQAIGMAKLVEHFGWTWVGILSNEDDYGRLGSQSLKEELLKYGICVAFHESLPTDPSSIKNTRIVETILLHYMKTVRFKNKMGEEIYFDRHGSPPAAYDIINWHREAGNVIRYAKVSYFSTSPLLDNKYEFPSFFRTIPSDDSQAQGLAQLVVHFGWTWVGIVSNEDDYGRLGSQSLKEQLLKYGVCFAFHESIPIEPSIIKINLIVKTIGVRFKNRMGEEIFFDKYGSPPAAYDIVNWQHEPDGIIRYVKVGSFEKREPRGQELNVNKSALWWTKQGKEVQ
ncbi:hypothetical protein NDU88_000645 [Pleurodeles waltl]|uniref:Receptor ligand binding region domain-containing protein n=1 Tax=Pleurodeles waltl TaxID=8319 RepID=A0AAV7KNC4_PLEWA|nr:hypothetical protein NDU88_000645 [Pleurodeles waltl]